ncbi:hypothetical protein A2U01_0027124, partial [Trifolium medium]|nr:hypothetical protein [Trifolium medium]
ATNVWWCDRSRAVVTPPPSTPFGVVKRVGWLHCRHVGFSLEISGTAYIFGSGCIYFIWPGSCGYGLRSATLAIYDVVIVMFVSDFVVLRVFPFGSRLWLMLRDLVVLHQIVLLLLTLWFRFGIGVVVLVVADATRFSVPVGFGFLW